MAKSRSFVRRIRRALGILSRRERAERRAAERAVDPNLADENARGGHRSMRP